MVSRFSYLTQKIKNSEFSLDPFQHIYIEDFFDNDDFKEIINCYEISAPNASSDQELIEGLKSRGYKVIDFPGCITDSDQYIKWHQTKDKIAKTHSACEGFGMVLRLYEKKSRILIELEEYLLSDEFNEAISDKFGFCLRECKVDGGIQKYLDGYEISPHPDIRRKAATYMVNINPSDTSEMSDHHTHYLRFKPSKNYVSTFWQYNPDYDRDWVPWDWCETVKQQYKNNSIVIFSPSNDTMHAVKANYNHLVTQRTQLYGNLWYLNCEAKPLRWEQLQVPKANEFAPGHRAKRFKSMVPAEIKSFIKGIMSRNKEDIGKTNMD